MSFFNLRRGGTSSKSTASLGTPAESLEIVRKRANHRLIGSAVLVVIGVIGFPLLFDTQPRPVSVGIPIEIPSKQGAKPLTLPVATEPEVVAAPAPVETPAPVKTPVEKVPEKVSENVIEKAPSAVPAAKPVDEPARAKAPPHAAGPAVANVSTAAAPSVPAPSSDELRLVVQVGAFADAAKARDMRLKLEKAGMKAYTQDVETKDGKRIRVRVGPYATKAEADKAAKQIKALDLPAAILTH